MSSRPRYGISAQDSNPIPYKTSLTPPSTKDKKHISTHSKESGSREVTPTVKPKDASMSEGALVVGLRDDMSKIKDIVTCNICNLLLFEPFTLGCGHTYCYTCLCTWFVDNRRKKTCPDCRTRVKIIPGQNYTVKSIVDVFASQSEGLMLLPAGETLEQCRAYQDKESKALEADKKSATGLFKGTFTRDRRPRLWRDEGDGGILRCPSCGHEHEGGPSCNVCGEEFAGDGDDFSDYDEEDDLEIDDLDHVEIDLDAESEVDAEFAALHGGHHHFHGVPGYIPNHHHRFHHPAIHHEAEDLSNSDGSEPFYDSEDPDSLDGFVVQDEDEETRRGGARARAANPERVTIDLTSDDESDEGGAISNGRSRRRFQAQLSPPPAVPNALSISDDSSVHGSDCDETRSEADVLLQNAGWSPLDNGNESEVEGPAGPAYGHAYADCTDDGNATEDDDDDRSDTTNTSTIDGNATLYAEHYENNDDEDDESSLSQTPTYNNAGYARHGSTYYNNYIGRYHSLSEDEDEGEDDEYGAVPRAFACDQDGDTEMSTSSRSHSRSESVTTDGRVRDVDEPVTNYGDDEGNYGYNQGGAREVSEPITDYDYGPDHITDNESGYGLDNGRSREISEPLTHYDDDHVTDIEACDHWGNPQPAPPSPIRFSSPEYSRNSLGRGNTTYDNPDAEDSDDSGYRIHTTYVANSVHEPEEESSDASIRGPTRRQPRQPRSYSIPEREAVRVHNYNPFEPVHTDVRRRRGDGAWYNPIMLDGASDDWEGAVRSVMEPSSRSRRMTAYRNMPARRIDPLRSSRSPSVNRIISSSSRGARYPRQYQRRG